jgi:hypothetical protein
VFAPGGRFCIWHVMEFKWDDDGQVKGNIGGNDAELIAKWPGLLFDNTRDYIAVNRIPALRRQFLNSLYTYRSS